MRQIFAHSVSISEQKFIIYLCVLGVCRATWVVAWDKSGKYLDWEAWKEGNIYTDLYSHDFWCDAIYREQNTAISPRILEWVIGEA